MKKLFIILTIIMFAGCSTASLKHKTTLPTPPVAPVTQVYEQNPCAPIETESCEVPWQLEHSPREILQMQIQKVEIGLFGLWWRQLLPLFEAEFSKAVNKPVTVETVNVGFMDNFDLAVIEIKVSIYTKEKIYIIVNRPNRTWTINSIVSNMPEDKSEDKTNHDYEL